MIRNESVQMIREKALEGKSAYRIAQELGISKNTAKKYMDTGSTEKAQYPKRQSKIDAFKPEIDRLMSIGVFNCVVIMERIQKLGYDGKITILKEYVHSFRPPKRHPAVRRYETAPGEQAQMDWGICSYLDENGTEHKISAFTMKLGYSRVQYVEFSKRCDLFSLLHCMLNAFEYFGGVPEKDLKKAKGKPSSKRWNTYTQVELLIIDEVGYSRLDQDAEEMLFDVISRRYETGSIILTSNKHFNEWSEIMSDTRMATAALDRLLHHASVINIRGNSYRLKNYETAN